MEPREATTAPCGWTRLVVVGATVASLVTGSGCRRDSSAARPEGLRGAVDRLPATRDGPPSAGGATFSFDRPLAGVVDPWSWPRARGATERERAVEDIGPYEPVDRERAESAAVNTNAHYWTSLVGLAWMRDVDIDLDREPVDLDGDDLPDTHVSRHVHVRGGILANPEIFGLTRTPDDPRGAVGKISVSTGILGLREALTVDGRPSGLIGMTCFLCHGAADPDNGQPVLGLPGATFDYGLMLATAAVLRDDAPGAIAYRRAHGFPSGRTVRARLLLAGPGRQDLTGEFGLDVTVPGAHSRFYPGTARVRQGTVGVVNPISVPGMWATDGLDVQNWSGSEVASASAVARLMALLGPRAIAVSLAAMNLPAVPPELLVMATAASASSTSDRADAHVLDRLTVEHCATLAPLRRALLLDLRNLGTLGLQQDSYPALLWADAIRGRARLDPASLVAIPRLYAASAIRMATEQAARAWRSAQAPVAAEGNTPSAPSSAKAPAARARAIAIAIARGRDLFSNRIVGRIANLQILKEAPSIYAAARLAGPLLSPLDPALPATFAVRCADCHSATPGGPMVSLDRTTPPLGRCSHCHRSHDVLDLSDETTTVTSRARADGLEPPRKSLADLGIPAGAAEEVARCQTCHRRHRSFEPVAYSSSLLLPFDANQDGMAQDDERVDARAGGIGTEALLAFDVPRPQRPRAGFSVPLPRLTDARAVAPITTIRLGVGWVRVAPLVALRASAPYLHNGSVPTLRALLEPAARRPVTFPVGQTGFELDTRLPGNRNVGHEFGTELTRAEKRDLVAFLETL